MSLDLRDIIPSSMRGWITFIWLTLITYAIYYLSLFGALMGLYREILYSIEDYPIEEDRVYVTVAIPEYVSNFYYNWIYLTIYNGSRDYTIYDAKAWFSLTREKPKRHPESNELWLYPYLYNNEQLRAKQIVEFPSLPPHGTVTRRIPIIAPGEGNIEGEIAISWVRDTGKEKKEFKIIRPILVERNYFLSLVHGTIERVMLPPWSNIFLLLLGLVIASSVDYSEPESSYLVMREKIISLLRVIIRATFSMFTVILMLLAIVIVFPFGKTKFLWQNWSLFVVLVFILRLIVFASSRIPITLLSHRFSRSTLLSRIFSIWKYVRILVSSRYFEDFCISITNREVNRWRVIKIPQHEKLARLEARRQAFSRNNVPLPNFERAYAHINALIEETKGS